MRISAWNIIRRRVKKVMHGALNSEITIQLPGGAEIVSAITKSSAKNLKPAKGKKAYAIIKATNVMIAVD